MVVLSPADDRETRAAVQAAYEYQGPVYLRLGRLAVPAVNRLADYCFEIGRGIVLRNGQDVTLAATGLTVAPALGAAEELAQQGISARVINIHTIKPLDEELLLQAASETGRVVTIEEHSVIGGLGSAVCELLAERLPTRVLRIGMQDTPDVDGIGSLCSSPSSRLLAALRLHRELGAPILISGGQVYADSGAEAKIARRVLMRETGVIRGHLSKDGTPELVLFSQLPYVEEGHLNSPKSLAHLQELTDSVKNRVDAVVSLGIGGSYLGDKVLFDVHCGEFWNSKSTAERGGFPKVYFSGNNIDPRRTGDLIEHLESQAQITRTHDLGIVFLQKRCRPPGRASFFFTVAVI